MSRNFFSVLAFAATAAFSVQSAVATVDIAVNGGFETGSFSGWTQFPSGNPGAQTIVSPGATNVAASAFAARLNNTSPGSANVLKNANIGVGVVGALSAITVEFDAQFSAGPGGVAFAELFSELSGGGVSSSVLLGNAPLLGGAPFGWRHFSFTSVTGSDVSGGVTVQFNAATGAFAGSTADLQVDNLVVTVTPVPAPAFASVFGLVGLAHVARRRRSV